METISKEELSKETPVENCDWCGSDEMAWFESENYNVFCEKCGAGIVKKNIDAGMGLSQILAEVLNTFKRIVG